MKASEHLSKKDARKIFLSNQLLTKDFAAVKSNLLSIIEALGYIQIDSASVIERSHHHILWTRMKNYKREMLDELLEKKKSIFEYWSHAAAYLPMKDFRYSLIRKRNFADNRKEWKRANKKMLNHVLGKIRNEGPLRSKDFTDTKNSKEVWSNSKSSKDALDFLFHTGRLMASKRINFQIQYDLTERVLPPNVNTTMPDQIEYCKHLIFRAINASGFANENEIMYLRRYDKEIFKKVISGLVEERKLHKVKIEGNNKEEYYSSLDNLGILNFEIELDGIHLLSPFDNLIIQRKRLKTLFEYDYRMECYLPQEKRIHGYFCLPVLYKDRFIGKIDAKASRQEKIFRINNFYKVEEKKLAANLLKQLEKKLMQLAEFTGCEKITGSIS